MHGVNWSGGHPGRGSATSDFLELLLSSFICSFSKAVKKNSFANAHKHLSWNSKLQNGSEAGLVKWRLAPRKPPAPAPLGASFLGCSAARFENLVPAEVSMESGLEVTLLRAVLRPRGLRPSG